MFATLHSTCMLTTLSPMLQAEVAEWVSSKHNMGMALTRAQWAAILACTNKFCKVGQHNN